MIRSRGEWHAEARHDFRELERMEEVRGPRHSLHCLQKAEGGCLDRRRSLPQGAALSPLVSQTIQLFIGAEQVSKISGERNSVLEYSAWFCGGRRHSTGTLGFHASLHVILVIKCLANILLISENYE